MRTSTPIIKTCRVLLFMIFAFIVFLSKSYATEQIEFKIVNSTEANYIINTYQGLSIIDIRLLEEYEQTHILGAVSVPLNVLGKALQSLNKAGTFLVYGSDLQLKQAMILFQNNGFGHVYYFSTSKEPLESTAIALISSANSSSHGRPAPLKSMSASISDLKNAAGYCVSGGGSTTYEYIQNVETKIISEGVLSITVNIFITNPDDCTYAEPCPAYDESPEFVNAWIDWNGNNTFDANERVIDAALTGYTGLNYYGTMSTSTVVSVPPDAIGATWMRVNLGWGSDPNDPCQSYWSWGNVTDVQVFVDSNPPEIKDISVVGIPNASIPLTNDPSQPGAEKVKFEADITENGNYEITEIKWIGEDITSGDGNPYEYIPVTGTHGNKKVTCIIVFKHIETGVVGNHKLSKNFNLFFYKDGFDKGTSGSPNWFRYWKKDGAVPGIGDAIYDGTMTSYGSMSSSGVMRLGKIASGQHYSSSIDLTTKKGSESFGGPSVKGIDCAAEVIGHETYHKWVNDQWKAGGAFNGKTDTDKGLENADHNDKLPDFYEKATSETDTNKTDTYDLETKKSSVYRRYGDNEYMAMRAGDQKRGLVNKDWSYPGKQSGGTIKSTVSSIGYLPSSVMLEGYYYDEAIDTNSSGFFDALQVKLSFDVSVSGLYTYSARLNDLDTNLITYVTNQVSLESNVDTLEILFSGDEINASTMDGPYLVSIIITNEYDEGEGSDTIYYTTSAYTASTFKEKEVLFNDYFSSNVIDSDVNFKYDTLVIDVGIHINQAGEYNLQGGLYDWDEKLIELFDSSLTLSEGDTIISLPFEGYLISRSRKDGPYYLRNLAITGDVLYDFIDTAYSTSAYNYTDFESSGTMYNGEFVENVIDTDGDELYDYLQFNIGINSELPGEFKLTGTLYDENGNQVVLAEQTESLLAGSNYVDFNFSGKTINAFGINGPYVLKEFILIDNAGSMVDYLIVNHTTESYLAEEFQNQDEPLITLKGNYIESKIDNNADCIYEYLSIMSEVELADTGYVVAKALLADSEGEEIVWAENIMYLLPDTIQHVVLNFIVDSIYNHGVEGPYQLKNLYVYHTGDPSLPDFIVDAYITAMYNLSNFDNLPGVEVELNEAVCNGNGFQVGEQIFYDDGQHIVELTNNMGCDSLVYLNLTTGTIGDPLIQLDGDTLTCDLEGEYIWYLDDEVISVETQSFVPTQTGTYQIAVINGIGCVSEMSNSIYFDATAIFDNDLLSDDLVIYPNPSSDKFYVRGINPALNSSISVYDNLGRKILNYSVNSNTMVIDLSSSGSGIYSVLIQQDNDRTYRRIVKL